MKKIRYEICLFLTAMTVYTRIPPPSWLEYSETYLNKATRYLPLVGIVVGIISAFVFFIADIVFSKQIAILSSMITTILITGAFHEDGFADCCDGFGGGHTKEQILTIMKDSNIGTFGAIGIGLLLALKFLALSEIKTNILPMAMIAGHSLSRFTAITFIYTHKYSQKDSLSKVGSLVKPITLKELVFSGIIGILPIFIMGKFYFLSIIPVFMLKYLLGKYFVQRLGGYTGDCLGATQQISELVFYLSCV